MLQPPPARTHRTVYSRPDHAAQAVFVRSIPIRVQASRGLIRVRSHLSWHDASHAVLHLTSTTTSSCSPTRYSPYSTAVQPTSAPLFFVHSIHPHAPFRAHRLAHLHRHHTCRRLHTRRSTSSHTVEVALSQRRQRRASLAGAVDPRHQPRGPDQLGGHTLLGRGRRRPTRDPTHPPSRPPSRPQA